MVDNGSTHVRKVGGVRFNVDTINTLNENEENPFHIAELEWERCCDNERSFDLYFGILKLSHSYSMKMNVVFSQNSVKLDAIPDDQHMRGLKLLVTEFEEDQAQNRTSFQVEIVITSETTPGHFHRTFLLREISKSQNSVTVNVSGKILRQGQGTATLRPGIRMKSIKDEKDDEE